MRLAQVAPFYYPQRGGVETVVKEYSERLVKRGHEVYVYTTDRSWNSAWVEEINGVKVHRSIRVPLPILKSLSPAPLFPSKLLKADVDLIHVHANKYFSTDMGALISKLKGKPLVYSPHAGSFGRSLFGKIHNQTIGRIALSANTVICVSDYERSLIQAAEIPIKSFRVLPNGVDIKKYEKDDHNSFAKLGMRPLPNYSTPFEGKSLVLYVGRISPHKGIDTLVDSASLVLEKIPEARFVVAGPDGGAEKNSKFKVQSSKLGAKFIFLGKVSEEEKIALMQKADVFVLPSRSEAFGITVVEAMAAGCPVIVSDIPALTEIVADDRTGLVFPVGDERSLADRLVKILLDQSFRQSLSESAKRRVKEKYDWEKIIDRLEEIYREILR